MGKDKEDVRVELKLMKRFWRSKLQKTKLSWCSQLRILKEEILISAKRQVRTVLCGEEKYGGRARAQIIEKNAKDGYMSKN